MGITYVRKEIKVNRTSGSTSVAINCIFLFAIYLYVIKILVSFDFFFSKMNSSFEAKFIPKIIELLMLELNFCFIFWGFKISLLGD